MQGCSIFFIACLRILLVSCYTSLDVVVTCLFFTVSPSIKERQIGEMMKNSGDSSKQLSMLNEQLSQKNRLVNAFCIGKPTFSFGEKPYFPWESLILSLEKPVFSRGKIISGKNIFSMENTYLPFMNSSLVWIISVCHVYYVNFPSYVGEQWRLQLDCMDGMVLSCSQTGKCGFYPMWTSVNAFALHVWCMVNRITGIGKSM